MTTRLTLVDPKQFPSLEKLLGKAPPLTKQQNEAELGANMRAWAYVLKAQKVNPAA